MKSIIPEIKNPVDGLERSDKSLQCREWKKKKKNEKVRLYLIY